MDIDEGYPGKGYLFSLLSVTRESFTMICFCKETGGGVGKLYSGKKRNALGKSCWHGEVLVG